MNKPLQQQYDIVIVGGGPAGAALACGLGNRAGRVALIEAVQMQSDAPPGYDDRGLAMSLSSYRILNGIGVWSRLRGKTVPIKHIHVSDQGHFGFVRLHAEELNLPAMGYVVVARELGSALLDRVAGLENMDFICPARVTGVSVADNQVAVALHGDAGPQTLACRLLVVADGAGSPLRRMLGIGTRTRDYQQTAIVSGISTEKNHDGTAFERFTSRGPLAMLPLADHRCVAVCTVPAAQTEDFMAMTDAGYLREIEQTFGRRLGRLTSPGSRRSYPVKLVVADEQYRDRVVLLGNSAHAIHPNGAQGLNLALRDAAALVEILIDARSEGLDPGAGQLLRKYHLARIADQQRIVGFTDRMTDLFYNDSCVKIISRNTAMQMLNLLPFARKRFMCQAMGIYGRQPALVRGGIPAAS